MLDQRVAEQGGTVSAYVREAVTMRLTRDTKKEGK